MGKSQSKLSSEELQELQKNTYCECRSFRVGMSVLLSGAEVEVMLTDSRQEGMPHSPHHHPLYLLCPLVVVAKYKQLTSAGASAMGKRYSDSQSLQALPAEYRDPVDMAIRQRLIGSTRASSRTALPVN